MSDAPENIVLVFLRRLDVKMDRVIDEVQDLKRRMTSLEASQSHLRHDIADLHAGQAGVQLRIDRVEQRLERIERRLDLQDAPR